MRERAAAQLPLSLSRREPEMVGAAAAVAAARTRSGPWPAAGGPSRRPAAAAAAPVIAELGQGLLWEGRLIAIRDWQLCALSAELKESAARPRWCCPRRHSALVGRRRRPPRRAAPARRRRAAAGRRQRSCRGVWRRHSRQIMARVTLDILWHASLSTDYGTRHSRKIMTRVTLGR